jgi:hypothetical protein
MSSSLEDRIRLLTDRAIAAKTQSELDAILPELKAAITDHIRYVRAIVVETIPEAFGRSKTAACRNANLRCMRDLTNFRSATVACLRNTAPSPTR